MTTFLLIHHGQTEWNRIERFRGRTDISLNDYGFEQARAAAAWVHKTHQPLGIFSSPLLRAMQTAGEIALPFGLQVTTLEGLNDIDYGEWQGLTPQEVSKRWPALLQEWNEHPQTVQLPMGETLALVQKRAMKAVRELCKNIPQGEVALVSHTVVNRLILLEVLGLGLDRFWKIHQDPCCINIFYADGNDFILHALNFCLGA